MKIRVAIAEDNLYLAQSIIEKLSLFNDLEFKFRTANGAELIGKLEQDHHVDVILMDIEMPVMNGIEATEIIKQKYPQIQIVMLTIHENDEMIFNAIKAGANGYLLKDESPEFIHKGIIDILNGGVPMSASIAYITLKLLRTPFEPCANNDDCNLTKREIELLEQLSAGLTYDEIADNLNISQGTVRKHIQNTYAKLQVRNKVEALQKAKNKRII
jgi:DNA-binding NarL/FixJ family response regulator